MGDGPAATVQLAGDLLVAQAGTESLHSIRVGRLPRISEMVAAGGWLLVLILQGEGAEEDAGHAPGCEYS